jgi:hypothetical protein
MHCTHYALYSLHNVHRGPEVAEGLMNSIKASEVIYTHYTPNMNSIKASEVQCIHYTQYTIHHTLHTMLIHTIHCTLCSYTIHCTLCSYTIQC